MAFEHVDEPETVAVLNGENTNPDAIAAALDFACDCLNADAERDDIEPSALDARAAALDYALTAWNIPDLPGTVAGLQRFWSA